MAIRVVMLLGLCLALAACGSRLNPLNWFGAASDTPAEAVEVVEAAPEDGREPVAQVVGLQIDPLPSGAIVTATGLPPRQGYWQAELVELSRENGVLIYEFRVAPPPEATPEGNRASREITTAVDLSVQDLAAIRQIAVQGANNRLTARR